MNKVIINIARVILGIISIINLIEFINKWYLLSKQLYITQQMYLQSGMMINAIWIFGCILCFGLLTFYVKKLENKKKCPYCAELINKEAVICRFCGKELPLSPIKETEEKIDILSKAKKTNMKIKKESKEILYNRKRFFIHILFVLILVFLSANLLLIYTNCYVNSKLVTKKKTLEFKYYDINKEIAVYDFIDLYKRAEDLLKYYTKEEVINKLHQINGYRNKELIEYSIYKIEQTK